MSRIAITGGGNPYALEFARSALAQDHEVLALGRSKLLPACFTLEFAHPVRNFRYFDARVYHALTYLIDFEPAYIVNFAAQGEGAASFPPSAWPYFYATNVHELVQLCSGLTARAWLKRFVQVSTSELYGSNAHAVDESAPVRPTSPYAHSKAVFDAFLPFSGLPFNIVRPSNCYGPGQQLHRVIPRALLCAASGARLPLHGGGLARKSYLEASDLAQALLTVLEHAPAGETYNAGPLESTPIREVVERVAAHMLVPFERLAEEVPARHGEDACYWLDSSKLRSLGWTPRVSWDAGLARMAAWANAYKDDLLRYPKTFQGLRP